MSNIVAFAFIVSVAFAFQQFAGWDATDFIAGCALWCGIRAWSIAEHAAK